MGVAGGALVIPSQIRDDEPTLARVPAKAQREAQREQSGVRRAAPPRLRKRNFGKVSFVDAGPRYRTVRPIAKGGMGRVDLAVRETGQFMRFYAVKRMHPMEAEREEARAMFLEEARLAGLIRHPNVVAVHDVGEDAEGPYLVMDFVEGLSLSNLLIWARDHDQSIPLPVCLRIVRDTADALHAAHELRAHDGSALHLVHRDVSPQNILLGYDGGVRLTDFGIAKALGQTHHTSTGLLKGKSGYLSPEQLRFKKPDRRSDIFSLGVVLFEVLTGRRLYHGADLTDVAGRILDEPPPDLRTIRGEVPDEVAALVVCMLAKDPAHRPQTGLDVAQRIDDILANLARSGEGLTLGVYLAQHFGRERDTLRVELGNLRQAIADETKQLKLPKRAAKWLVAAAIALAIGAGIGIALLIPPSSEAVNADAREEAAPAAEEAASAAEEASPAVEAAPAEEVEPAAVVGEVAAAPSEDEASAEPVAEETGETDASEVRASDGRRIRRVRKPPDTPPRRPSDEYIETF
jgi:serine/threonine-protein kinase